mgnify:CR=1 FL=1
MSGDITFSLFDPARAKPPKISSSYQKLVKNIDPANAADMAVYPDINPQYINATYTLRETGLNSTTP